MTKKLSHPETFWVALEKLPHYAARVGVIISFASTIEALLPRWLMKVADVSGNHASVIIDSFMSISHRVDLIETIVNNGMADTALVAGTKRAIPWAREALRIRNKYAHARFGISANDTLAVDCYFHDSKKKAQSFTATTASIDAEIRLMKEAYCALSNYIFADEMPPERPSSNPQASRAQKRRHSANRANARLRSQKQPRP